MEEPACQFSARPGLGPSGRRPALADPAARGKLGADLVRRCEEMLKRRNEIGEYPRIGEKWSQGEGWKSFEASGWEGRTLDLFNCAGEAASVLKK